VTIWRYDAKSADPNFVHLASEANICVFCRVPLELADIEENNSAVNLIRTVYRTCNLCGWWTVSCIHDDLQKWPTVRNQYGAAAILRQFDPTGLSEPLSDVRRYLTAKYDSRFHVDPRRFEEVVASVFRDLGFHAAVTGYTGDDGIDIVLTGPNDRQIGVQVKRSKNTIKVEGIRALMGALVVNNLTAGAFVTTSTFQRGARRTVDLAAIRGIAIELVDATRFLDALRLSACGETSKNTYPRLSVSDMTFMHSEKYKSVTEWLKELHESIA